MHSSTSYQLLVNLLVERFRNEKNDMNKEESVRIATEFIEKNGMIVSGIESVRFVDINQVPNHLKKRKSSFWVVVFGAVTCLDTVNEHDGIVLNINDDSSEVIVLR